HRKNAPTVVAATATSAAGTSRAGTRSGSRGGGLSNFRRGSGGNSDPDSPNSRYCATTYASAAPHRPRSAASDAWGREPTGYAYHQYGSSSENAVATSSTSGADRQRNASPAAPISVGATAQRSAPLCNSATPSTTMAARPTTR